MINLVYLLHRRREFVDFTFKILSKCRNKDFHITICGFRDGPATHTAEHAEQAVDKARALGLSASSLVVDTHPRNNYLTKLHAAVKLDYEYSMKLDEDVFISSDMYDFMFDNLHLLDDKNLILFPALCNGVPTCDDFIEHNLTPWQASRLHNAFTKSRVLPNLWSYNWNHINKILAKGYNKDIFYAEVSKIKSHFKGIHPIRYDVKSQQMMNRFVLQNIDGFLQKREPIIKTMTAPYFCNSCFVIKTDDWRKVLGSQHLYVDPFDEVVLNRYRTEHNKEFLYIANCFGVHIMYALVATKVGREAEKIFFREFSQQIMKQL